VAEDDGLINETKLKFWFPWQANKTNY